MNKSNNPLAVYDFVRNVLREERGTFALVELDRREFRYLNFESLTQVEVINYFLEEQNVEYVLDVIELFCRSLGRDDLIDQINGRLKEAGLGYIYQNGKLLKIDSEFLHSEAVVPVLELLADAKYQNANDEFRAAFDHYRHGNFEDALTSCNRALESTLKIIAHEKNYMHKETDNAKRLIDIVFDNGLIPSYLQSQFTALRSCLESGVPTIRNKAGGHGKGTAQVTIPDYLVSYTLHLTAANMLLLLKAAS